MKSNEAFLETVLENLPVALFVKDASDDFRMIVWNKKQEQVTALRKEDALGKTDFELFSEESANYFREVDEAVVQGGKLLDVPREVLDKEDGEEIWLHTMKMPVEDSAGQRDLVVGISEDISERVRLSDSWKRSART